MDQSPAAIDQDVLNSTSSQVDTPQTGPVGAEATAAYFTTTDTSVPADGVPGMMASMAPVPREGISVPSPIMHVGTIHSMSENMPPPPINIAPRVSPVCVAPAPTASNGMSNYCDIAPASMSAQVVEPGKTRRSRRKEPMPPQMAQVAQSATMQGWMGPPGPMQGSMGSGAYAGHPCSQGGGNTQGRGDGGMLQMPMGSPMNLFQNLTKATPMMPSGSGNHAYAGMPHTAQGFMQCAKAAVENVEEASRRREVRLQKNREAARECRRKKKQYIKYLEDRVSLLEGQNKVLMSEFAALRDYLKAMTPSINGIFEPYFKGKDRSTEAKGLDIGMVEEDQCQEG